MKNFSEVILGQQVHFYVLRLKESFLLWVGTDVTFDTLAVAMNTRFVRTRRPCVVTFLALHNHYITSLVTDWSIVMS